MRCAKTLKNHRACNAHFLGDVIRYFNTVNLGIAVDTERGLLVPTVFSAESYSLNDLSSIAKQTIEMAKTGKISPDLLTGGTFTVTNLGALGVESFTPVINPPQNLYLRGVRDYRKGEDRERSDDGLSEHGAFAHV